MCVGLVEPNILKPWELIMPRPIITGQHVKPEKLARAKELRRTITPAERCLWQALRRNP